MAEKKEKKKKPVKKLQSMHDEVVKEFLSDNETAKSFFTEYLSPEIVKNLNFNTLHICKDTFLNKKLAKYFSDILYQVNLNNINIFIYLLIDHKSREEGFMGFQFLKYMVRIWELYLKQNKGAKTLPVIIPLVIYHGPKKWEVDTRFTSFFNAPGYLEEYIPDFNYKLYDISHVPDEEIKGAVLLRILFMTLKYVFTPGLNYKLREEIFPLFFELKDKNKGTEYLEVLLRYLTRSSGNLPENELNEAVTQLFEEGGDLMQTIAEKWKKEGKKEEKLDTAKRMLLNNFSVEQVISVTGLTEKEVKALIN
jgi:predicted transposase/invertase (TIGR01784 family)